MTIAAARVARRAMAEGWLSARKGAKGMWRVERDVATSTRDCKWKMA